MITIDYNIFVVITFMYQVYRFLYSKDFNDFSFFFLSFQDYKTFEREILTTLRDCECVTKLLDHWSEKNLNHIRQYLVMEFCPYNLRGLLTNKKLPDLSLDVIKGISYQLLSGVDYIHGLNVS